MLLVFQFNTYLYYYKIGFKYHSSLFTGEFIRYIIPKGISFDNLTNKNIIDMMNNINNVQRKSLDFHSPYDLFTAKYGADISKVLLSFPELPRILLLSALWRTLSSLSPDS